MNKLFKKLSLLSPQSNRPIKRNTLSPFPCWLHWPAACLWLHLIVFSACLASHPQLRSKNTELDWRVTVEYVNELDKFRAHPLTQTHTDLFHKKQSTWMNSRSGTQKRTIPEPGSENLEQKLIWIIVDINCFSRAWTNNNWNEFWRE